MEAGDGFYGSSMPWSTVSYEGETLLVTFPGASLHRSRRRLDSSGSSTTGDFSGWLRRVKGGACELIGNFSVAFHQTSFFF